MPKLIDKYSYYETINNGGVASTLLYGYLGDKVSEEKKMEILQKLSTPTIVGSGNMDDAERLYGDRFSYLTYKINQQDLDMRDVSDNLPGISQWIQPGAGKYFKEPEMEEVMGIFEDGMRQMLDILEENEKELDLSDPNAQNHYQLLKGILKNSYEGTLISKMTEDPSYGTAIALTAKVAFETETPEYDKKENKYKMKRNGTPTKDVLRGTADLGIVEAMAGNTRVSEKFQENISNGNTSRQELLQECEAQSKRLDKMLGLKKEQVDKLQKRNILQNDVSEYTDGDRGILFSVYDMKAKQELLKAGYPAEDIAPMSAFYVQMSLYDRAIHKNQATLDAKMKENPQPDDATKKKWEEEQEKINNMKEVCQDMQATWKEITDPEKGPLTQEKRAENLGRMKENFDKVIKKQVIHPCLNQFKDRIDKRMNAELNTGDKAMLAGDYTAMYEALKEADPRTLFTGSKQFKDLKNSVKELAEMDQQLTPEEKKTNLTYQAKRRGVLEKAQTYLRYKNRQMNGPDGHKHKRSALEAQRVQAVDAVYSRLLADMQRENPKIKLKESEMTIQTRLNDRELLTPMPAGEAKNFDDYIRSHTGKGAMSGTKEEMVDDMAKVLAAQIMPRQKPPKEFDPKVIDKAAEQIKEKFNLAGMDELDLREALNNPTSVREMAQKRHRMTYSVEPEDYHQYLGNMRMLYRDMEKPDGSSKEYERLYENVKKIAHLPSPSKLEEYEVSAQKLGKLIEQTNSQIFEAMDRYVDKNAKQIGPRDPKMLQVLSAMSDAVPTAGDRANKMVDRIRSIKGIKDISNYEYIELGDYDRNKKYGLSKSEEQFTLDPDPAYRKDLIKGITMDERERLAFQKLGFQKQSPLKPQAKEAPDMAPKGKKLESVKPEAEKKSKVLGDKAKKNYVKEKKQQARGVDDKGRYL